MISPIFVNSLHTALLELTVPKFQIMFSEETVPVYTQQVRSGMCVV